MNVSAVFCMFLWHFVIQVLHLISTIYFYVALSHIISKGKKQQQQQPFKSTMLSWLWAYIFPHWQLSVWFFKSIPIPFSKIILLEQKAVWRQWQDKHMHTRIKISELCRWSNVHSLLCGVVVLWGITGIGGSAVKARALQVQKMSKWGLLLYKTCWIQARDGCGREVLTSWSKCQGMHSIGSSIPSGRRWGYDHRCLAKSSTSLISDVDQQHPLVHPGHLHHWHYQLQIFQEGLR